MVSSNAMWRCRRLFAFHLIIYFETNIFDTPKQNIKHVFISKMEWNIICWMNTNTNIVLVTLFLRNVYGIEIYTKMNEATQNWTNKIKPKKRATNSLWKWCYIGSECIEFLPRPKQTVRFVEMHMALRKSHLLSPNA